MTLSMWPSVNAVLNAASAGLLLLGYRAIRAKRLPAHLAYMLGACACSTLFFLSYLLYHARVGSVGFAGGGGMRRLYLAILISHSVLAIVIVPLVIRTLWLAARQQLDGHRRWARVTLPLWLYVSVTGVIVYWLLYWWS